MLLAENFNHNCIHTHIYIYIYIYIYISMFCWRPWSIFFLEFLSENVWVLFFLMSRLRCWRKCHFTDHLQGLCLIVCCCDFLYLFLIFLLMIYKKSIYIYVVRLVDEWSETQSNVKLDGFRSRLQASCMSSHPEEFW